MTRFRTVFNRLGSPAAVSWPTFWSTFVLNLYAVYWGGLTPTASWSDRLIALVISQGTMWGFLLLCRFTVLRSIATRRRPLVALTCFALSGIVRAFTVEVLYSTLLDAGSLPAGTRVLAGVVFGLAAFVPVTLVVSTVRDYRSVRAGLIATRSQLTTAAEALVVELNESDHRVTDRIRDQILESLSDLERAGTPDELERFASEVVRPLSHQLADEVPTWEPPPPAPVRVRGIEVVDRALSGSPLMPTTTTAAIFAIIFLNFWLNATGPGAWVFFVTSMVAFWLALVAVNRALPLVLPGRSAGVRLAIIVALLAAVGLTLGTSAQVFVGAGPLRQPWVLGSVLLTTAVGLGLAVARAALAELEATLSELREADERLAWQVARLRTIRWLRRKRVARALHGPVQGAIASAALRRREGTESDALVFAALRTALLDVLSLNEQPRTFAAGLELVRANWSGVCDVTLTTASEDLRILDGDPDACEIAIDIVTEAVSNAVRHGNAGHVSIEATCSGDLLTVQVTDDGGAAEKGRTGLGTRLLDECAVSWSRQVIAGRSRLEVRLPLEATP